MSDAILEITGVSSEEIKRRVAVAAGCAPASEPSITDGEPPAEPASAPEHHERDTLDEYVDAFSDLPRRLADSLILRELGTEGQLDRLMAIALRAAKRPRGA